MREKRGEGERERGGKEGSKGGKERKDEQAQCTASWAASAPGPVHV